MDYSAKDLNRSKSTDKIIFHNTLILEMSPTEPSEELAGFLSADVILEVKYSRTVVARLNEHRLEHLKN
jgi:hypothetical protein